MWLQQWIFHFEVRRHARPQKLFAPARERHVAIADRPAQRLGQHARVVLQIGQFKAGQIVDLADVRRGIVGGGKTSPISAVDVARAVSVVLDVSLSLRPCV